MTLRIRLVVPMALLAFAVPSVHAQGMQGMQGVQGTRTAAGPTFAHAAVGVRAATVAQSRAQSRLAAARRNRAMMIVGGVAFVVGAIIGGTPGTIVMLGGAGVGLYGLFKYLE